MKQKIKYILPVVIFFTLLTWYTEERYGVGIIEYWKYAASMNVWEKSYLEQKGEIKYGVDENAAPLSFYDEESSEFSGIVSDYVSTLSIEMGIPIVFVKVDMDNREKALKGELIDTADLFKHDEEKDSFIYTQEIYKLEGAVLKETGNSKIRKIRNLRDKKVAVISGDYSEKVLSKMFEEERIILCQVKNISQAISLIEDGKVDAIAGDKMVIQYYLKNSEKSKKSYEFLDESLYSRGVTLAVDKEDKMLLGILNKSIFSIKKKKLLPQIQDKWLGTSGMIVGDNKDYTWVPVFFGIIIMLGYILFLWDKFLRKKINIATIEIQEQKNSLRAIIDSVNFALLVIDEAGTVIECNNESLKITSQKYENILNRNISELYFIGSIYDKYNENMCHNQKCEDRYYYIDSHIISKQLGTKVILCEDITKRLMVEKELSQKNKMVAVGQLSAGLAHEIRTPLGLIKNYKYIINEYATDEISKHAVEVIGESVDRVNSLIENLLSFSRLSNDTLNSFDLEKNVENLLILEKKRALKNDIRIETVFDKKVSILTNEEVVKIVVLNLVNNAMEALLDYKTEGEKLITVRFRLDHKNLNIEVEDNGPGIEAGELENIFNPFYTTKDEGTGLGLYIVSTELEKMNGFIKVKSSQNAKTVFTATIPNVEEVTDFENEQLQSFDS